MCKDDAEPGRRQFFVTAGWETNTVFDSVLHNSSKKNFVFLWPAEEPFPNVIPQTLIPEAINERAEKARNQHEAEVIKKGNVFRQPVCVDLNESFRDGVSESQHAEQQLEAVQQYGVHRFAHRRSVLPQLPGFHHNPHIGEKYDNTHHCKEKHIHSKPEQSLDHGRVNGSSFAKQVIREGIYSTVVFPNGKLNDRECEADQPYRQNNDPDMVWTPGGWALQGVENGNITLQWHGS